MAMHKFVKLLKVLHPNPGGNRLDAQFGFDKQSALAEGRIHPVSVSVGVALAAPGSIDSRDVVSDADGEHP